MKDHSQNGEQKIILDYFGLHTKAIGGVNEARVAGTLLDIGANDGQTYSNSRALIELGWKACLVEPAEIAFKKLQMNNLVATSERLKKPFTGTPQDIVTHLIDGLAFSPSEQVQCINAAITTQDGPIDFYDSGTHLKKGDTSLLSTTRPEEMARWKKSGEVFTKTTVRGITFETLQKETGLTHADFVSIDAEGADLSILLQMDLTALGVRCLCVEANQSPERHKFVDYAGRHGMRLHWTSYENCIFIRS